MNKIQKVVLLLATVVISSFLVITALSAPPEIIDADETEEIEEINIGIVLQDILNKANTEDIEYTILKTNLSIEDSYDYYNELFINQGYDIQKFGSYVIFNVNYMYSAYIRGISVVGLLCVEGQESNYVVYTITDIFTANKLGKQFGIEPPV